VESEVSEKRSGILKKEYKGGKARFDKCNHSFSSTGSQEVSRAKLKETGRMKPAVGGGKKKKKKKKDCKSINDNQSGEKKEKSIDDKK